VPGQVVVTYYAVQPADMTASGLMRTDVYNLQDERLGRIEDLVIGAAGRSPRSWSAWAVS
jgi:hypothetical protein